MKLQRYYSVTAFIAALLLFGSCNSNTGTLQPEEDRSGFVYITDVIPDAMLDIRYYDTYNFIGDRMLRDAVRKEVDETFALTCSWAPGIAGVTIITVR